MRGVVDEYQSDIDWRNLLKKYIDHVGECEGVHFIPDQASSWRGKLSEQEAALLRDLWKEIEETIV